MRLQKKVRHFNIEMGSAQERFIRAVNDRESRMDNQMIKRIQEFTVPILTVQKTHEEQFKHLKGENGKLIKETDNLRRNTLNHIDSMKKTMARETDHVKEDAQKNHNDLLAQMMVDVTEQEYDRFVVVRSGGKIDPSWFEKPKQPTGQIRRQPTKPAGDQPGGAMATAMGRKAMVLRDWAQAKMIMYDA